MTAIISSEARWLIPGHPGGSAAGGGGAAETSGATGAAGSRAGAAMPTRPLAPVLSLAPSAPSSVSSASASASASPAMAVLAGPIPFPHPLAAGTGEHRLRRRLGRKCASVLAGASMSLGLAAARIPTASAQAQPAARPGVTQLRFVHEVEIHAPTGHLRHGQGNGPAQHQHQHQGRHARPSTQPESEPGLSLGPSS